LNRLKQRSRRDLQECEKDAPANPQRRWNRDRHRKTGCNSSKKPFDILAEGLISKDSRGNRTAIELFMAGIRGWEAGLRRRLDDGAAERIEGSLPTGLA
jgi:hypothetical protein